MKIWFFIFLFLINLNVKSQIKGVARYNLTFNGSKLNQNVQEIILYFNDKSSVEFVGKVYNNEEDNNDETKGYITMVNKQPYFLYKNFSIKKINLSGLVGLKNYLVDDSLSNFKWIITKEKRKILNYNCIKATTQFRGRNYEAWYTESIPLQNGPWKFCGLPGLIIMVKDDKEVFTYKLTAIDLKAKFDEKIISIPKEYFKEKSISHKQFMALYYKKIKDYAKLSKVIQTGKNGGYGNVSITLPEEMEKF